MRTPFRLVLGAAALVAAAPAKGLGCHDLGAIAPIQQAILAQYPLSGSSCLRLEQAGVTEYEAATGSFTLPQVVSIASATKTLSAAVLLSLVDTGLLSLDDTVGQYLPEWNFGARAAITLRMCFSHTAGLPPEAPSVGDGTITLRQCAAQLALVPLDYAPGTAFEYGGVSMQVAGAVCEVVSGLGWNTLFQQRIATPLQMTATDFGAFGSATSPRIAGGARSNLRDFAVFVEMLRAGGTWNGVSVLSAASVATMLTDQTSGLPVIATPHPENAPYGIGIWLDRRDSQGRTVLATAAGAFGFTGWVDRERDATGVLVVLNHYPNMHPFVRQMQGECAAAQLPRGVACLGVGSPACAGEVWLNGTSAVTSGNAEFALLAARAPANGVGAFVLGAPLANGVALADLLAFVDLGGAVLAGVTADATGRAQLAAPLPAALAGQQFAVQSLWLSPAPCTALGLQAGHAVTLTVQP